jgi:hypothetical protein
VRVRFLVLEGGTIIHLTLTYRFLLARILRWRCLLCNREVWEEWKQQKKGHGFHGSMITVENRRSLTPAFARAREMLALGGGLRA